MISEWEKGSISIPLDGFLAYGKLFRMGSFTMIHKFEAKLLK